MGNKQSSVMNNSVTNNISIPMENITSDNHFNFNNNNNNINR